MFFFLLFITRGFITRFGNFRIDLKESTNNYCQCSSITASRRGIKIFPSKIPKILLVLLLFIHAYISYSFSRDQIMILTIRRSLHIGWKFQVTFKPVNLHLKLKNFFFHSITTFGLIQRAGNGERRGGDIPVLISDILHSFYSH